MEKILCLCKADAIDNGTGLSYNEVHDAETGTCVDGARLIDDDGTGKVKNNVDIVTREKETDTNSQIHYILHLSKYKISITPDKTNKTFIAISI